jgi:hypothetical protein
MSRALILLASGAEIGAWDLSAISGDMHNRDVQQVASLIFNTLRSARENASARGVLMRVLFALPDAYLLDTYALARAVILWPELLHTVERLRDPGIYGDDYRLIEAIGSDYLRRNMKWRATPRELTAAEMRDLLARVVRGSGAHRWRGLAGVRAMVCGPDCWHA